MNALSPALALAVSTLLALPWPWLPSARERTSTALEAWQNGELQAAAAALEEALELDPDNPRVRFNAGTGRLATGRLEEAAEILSEVARADDGDLSPDAFYNLGNAFLEYGDPAGAVEAYKQSLRLEPTHAAAKHNLELALRQEEDRRDSGEEPQEESGGDGGDGQPGTTPRPDDPSDEGSQEGPLPDNAGGPPAPEESEPSPKLPDFEPQEDMTAEQAAALLDAVDALERDQRRAQAAETRRLRALAAGTEKDW